MPVITEKQFLEQIIELAKIYQWEVYHVVDQYNYARRTSKGFPDLTLVRENEDGTASLIFLEIKSLKGKLSEAQQEWLTLLGKVPGVVAKCVRPPVDELVELLQR